MGYNLSLIVHFLHSYLDFFPKIAVSDERGEHFHQEISAMKKMYQGKWNPNILVDYRYTIKSDALQVKYSRKIVIYYFIWVRIFQCHAVNNNISQSANDIERDQITNSTAALYTSSRVGRLPATDAICGREKKFMTAHECPLYISTKGNLPRFISLPGKN